MCAVLAVLSGCASAGAATNLVDAGSKEASKAADTGVGDAGGCGSLTSCSGHCVDIESDDDNCGGCGLSCPGGCKAGECMTVLATVNGYALPWGVAIDSTSIYWTNSQSGVGSAGSLMEVGLAGGLVTTLATGENPQPIAVSTSRVYWADDLTFRLLSIPLGGGTVTTISSTSADGSAGGASGIAVDALNVYWTGTDTVNQAPAAGGAVSTLASLQDGPTAIAVDATNVYWTTASTIATIGLAGGTSTTLASGQSFPMGIAVDSASVYWINAGTSINDNTDGSVVRVALGGGAVQTLASGQNHPMGVTIDDTNVYWTTMDAVMKIPLDGGTPQTLVSGMGPVGIVLDATSVYFANDLYSGSGGEEPSGVGTIIKLTPK